MRTDKDDDEQQQEPDQLYLAYHEATSLAMSVL